MLSYNHFTLDEKISIGTFEPGLQYAENCRLFRQKSLVCQQRDSEEPYSQTSKEQAG